MSYPGNPALPPDVQARILQTYGQSLDLAAAGKLQEARLGCDFVLRLDPMFAPATKLQTRLADATGAITVDDLRPGAFAEAPPEFGELGDLPDLEPLPAPGADTLRGQLQALLAQRDLRGVLALAGAHQADVVADPDLRRMAMQASERLEAEPLVLGMVDAAQRALDAGDTDEARRQLEQARALDADHPRVLSLEGRLGSDDLDLDDEALPGFGAELSDPADTGAGASLLDGVLDAPAFGLDAEPGLDLESAAPALGAAPPAFDLGLSSSSAEKDPRIRELLDEGQRAFEKGEFQAAIDAWSRIFLIDIDHQEANRRIEEARKRRAEGERVLESRLHDAESLVDQGDVVGARAMLQGILDQQPGYYAARELLERLENAEQEPATASPASPGARKASAAEAVLTEEILVPPEPGAAPRQRPSAPSLPKPKAKSGRKLPMLIGAGLLVLVLAGGTAWWLMTRGDQVFPNTVEPVADDLSPIDRARALYDGGKPANAIALLKRVPEGDTHFQEAQQLLGEWEKPAEPVGLEPEIDPAEIARLEKLQNDARAAFAERRLLLAATLYDQLAETITLEPEDAERHKQAKVQREALAEVRRWLAEAEYEQAMPEIWRLYEEDNADRDLRDLLVTGYYNLALRDVQRGLFPKAIESLQEAEKLAPEDEGVSRLLAFARTYKDRSEDLLARIYTKYSSSRVP